MFIFQCFVGSKWPMQFTKKADLEELHVRLPPSSAHNGTKRTPSSFKKASFKTLLTAKSKSRIILHGRISHSNKTFP